MKKHPNTGVHLKGVGGSLLVVQNSGRHHYVGGDGENHGSSRIHYY